MMVVPVIINDYFLNYILPFVLVFTLIFAILQKSKLLGEDKKQIDAIIGLVVGLMLIAFPYTRYIVVGLVPFLAVSAVILLVFMLLYGFVVAKKDGDVLGHWWKVAIGAILSVALIVVLLHLMGYWNLVVDYVYGAGNSSNLLWNVIFVVIIIGAVIAVIVGAKD